MEKTKTITKDPLSLRERVGVRGSKNKTSLARALRHQTTDAEQQLWKYLRGRRLAGYKFRRQMVIDDFVCLEAKLIVEADGGQHSEKIEYDGKRTEFLESLGYTVIRFWNNDILRDINAVLEEIRQHLIEIPSPLTLSRRERGLVIVSTGMWCTYQ